MAYLFFDLRTEWLVQGLKRIVTIQTISGSVDLRVVYKAAEFREGEKVNSNGDTGKT